jgi:hypothetical protein
MTTTAEFTYPFTEADARAAHEEWGANCGPNALAFALQIPLEKVRPLIPGFEAKRYTSPTMMKAALANAGRSFDNFACDPLTMFHDQMSLTRIQWTGPWTAPGANPKWAYRQTHWIATYQQERQPVVFDVNGGCRLFVDWQDEIIPLILETIPRNDGGWHPTHIWRLNTP